MQYVFIFVICVEFYVYAMILVGVIMMKTLYPILLSTNLASTTADRQDLLLTLASTADDLSSSINIDQ